MIRWLKSKFSTLTPQDRLFLRRITTEGNYSRTERILRIINQFTESGRNRWEHVSIEDLEKMDIEELLVRVIKTNPTLDQSLLIFSLYATQDPMITSESDRGQRAIDEVLDMLEDIKNPWDLFIDHLTSSLFIRGNFCAETVFSRGLPQDLVSVDPRWFEWRRGTKGWKVGQYTEGEWKAITSPNVYWDAFTPIIGERTGRSPLQTALPGVLDNQQMRTGLQKIVDTHAYPRTHIKYRILDAMKEEEISPDHATTMQNDARDQISGWSHLKPGESSVSSDFVEVSRLPGTGSGLSFLDMLDRLYDRHSLRGAKLPPNLAGSNEFTAESSAKVQQIFYDEFVKIAQKRIKKCAEWAMTRFLRSMGVSDEVIYSYGSANPVTRQIEAEAFNAMMKGIMVATKSGMSLELAMKFYESQTDTQFDAEILDMVVKEAEEKERKAEEMAQQLTEQSQEPPDGQGERINDSPSGD